jgi:alpha-mannosidase
VPLPSGDFNRVYLLAIAVHGDTTGEFRVDDHKTLLKVEDWSGYIGQWDNRSFEGHVPELTYGVNNKLLRIKAGFIKRSPLAWFCSHRHHPAGDEAYTYSYLFKYGIDVPGGAKTLTLPDNPRIRVLAVSMASDENASTVPAQPLYDDFAGRTAMALSGE